MNKCAGIMGRIFGHSFAKYGKVIGFEFEMEFPLVSDEECYRLGEVPESCRKLCSFDVRCQRCGLKMEESK